ncbi:MAG TPA: serine/threonine-protein kinase [Acidimicrobiales bacterium]|nr:serine/threonine-protein kinase [Acidimicrobiales bacterium]
MSIDTGVSSEAARIAQAMPDYDVERELGRGGMGVVYLGRHRRLDRGVAIKELPPSFAAEAEVRDRFSAEARTLATLAHPHIVPIFDYVEREGLCLIVMEQLPGGTVWDRFTTSGLTPPTACAVVMACCAALQHAHTKGVLHLDVKPDNLMFDAESAVKVTDFGIARVISGGRTMGTVDGQVLGTPAYMSPEQARGEDLTPASDVYAAGVMLYELLSGQLPWQGAESAAELLSQRLREDPIPLRDVAPHVPQPLADVVMTSLSRDATERYQRAEDLGVAIGEACADSWGPDWLDHAGIAIVGSERLSRAARTTGHHVSAPAAPTAAAAPPPVATPPVSGSGPAGETITRGPAGGPGAGSTIVTGAATTGAPRAAETGAVATPPAATGRAHETIARPVSPSSEVPGAAATGAVAPAAPATGALAPAPPADDAAAKAGATPAGDPGAPIEFQVVRSAAADERIEGADLYQLEMADLIGVEDVLDPPKPPWPALLLTAGLFLAAAVVALVGPGGPDRTGSLVTDQAELAGADALGGGRIHVDLSEDVTVTVTDERLARSVDGAELELGYLGIPVSTISAPVRDGEAILDPGIAQRTIGGPASARLVLLSGDEVVADQELGVDATQSWYLTVPFVGGLLLLLLALANLESSLKPLRSGHSRVLSFVGACVSGALAGASLAVLAGPLGFSEPTLASLVAAAAFGALGGVAAARARIGVARRRRVRRAVRRAEKSLGVHADAA